MGGERTDLAGQISEQKGHDLFRPIIMIDRTLHEPARLAIVTLLANMVYKLIQDAFSESKPVRILFGKTE
jgi:hypothetical protein